MPNFDIFDKNEFADTIDNPDDNEISSFIDENRNENTTKRKKLTLMYGNDGASPSKKQVPLKKFLPRNLTTFCLISSLKQ